MPLQSGSRKQPSCDYTIPSPEISENDCTVFVMVAVTIRVPTFPNDLQILQVSGARRPSHSPLLIPLPSQASPPRFVLDALGTQPVI